MENIQPKLIYVNGQEVEAIKLNLYSTSDNLVDSANFTYQLIDVNNTPLITGELRMFNPDYDLWNGDSNINYSAYQWAASKLNVTLI